MKVDGGPIIPSPFPKFEGARNSPPVYTRYLSWTFALFHKIIVVTVL